MIGVVLMNNKHTPVSKKVREPTPARVAQYRIAFILRTVSGAINLLTLIVNRELNDLRREQPRLDYDTDYGYMQVSLSSELAAANSNLTQAITHLTAANSRMRQVNCLAHTVAETNAAHRKAERRVVKKPKWS